MRTLAMLLALACLAGCTGPDADGDGDAPPKDGPATAWSAVEAENNGGFRLGQSVPCARTPTEVDPGCVTFGASLIVPAGHRGLALRLNVTDGAFVDLLADGPADCDVGPASSGTGSGPWSFTATCPDLPAGEHQFEINMAQGNANGRLQGSTMAAAPPQSR